MASKVNVEPFTGKTNDIGTYVSEEQIADFMSTENYLQNH